MTISTFLKELKMQDLMILWLDEQGLSDSEIANLSQVSKQTIHNTKNRLKPLTDALNALETQEYGNSDINTVITAFTNAFGNTKTTQYDRYAAKRLVTKYPVSEVVGAINALAESQGDKFAPSVRSVSQFEEKLPNIASYFKKKSTNQEINL